MEELYEQLEGTIKEIPRIYLIIQGDWNANVEPDASEQWAGTVERFGAGETNETNERGDRLLEFAHRHKMVVVNNLFPIRSQE